MGADVLENVFLKKRTVLLPLPKDDFSRDLTAERVLLIFLFCRSSQNNYTECSDTFMQMKVFKVRTLHLNLF